MVVDRYPYWILCFLISICQADDEYAHKKRECVIFNIPHILCAPDVSKVSVTPYYELMTIPQFIDLLTEDSSINIKHEGTKSHSYNNKDYTSSPQTTFNKVNEKAQNNPQPETDAHGSLKSVEKPLSGGYQFDPNHYSIEQTPITNNKQYDLTYASNAQYKRPKNPTIQNANNINLEYPVNYFGVPYQKTQHNGSPNFHIPEGNGIHGEITPDFSGDYLPYSINMPLQHAPVLPNRHNKPFPLESNNFQHSNPQSDFQAQIHNVHFPADFHNFYHDDSRFGLPYDYSGASSSNSEEEFLIPVATHSNDPPPLYVNPRYMDSYCRAQCNNRPSSYEYIDSEFIPHKYDHSLQPHFDFDFTNENPSLSPIGRSSNSYYSDRHSNIRSGQDQRGSGQRESGHGIHGYSNGNRGEEYYEQGHAKNDDSDGEYGKVIVEGYNGKNNIQGDYSRRGYNGGGNIRVDNRRRYQEGGGNNGASHIGRDLSEDEHNGYKHTVSRHGGSKHTNNEDGVSKNIFDDDTLSGSSTDSYSGGGHFESGHTGWEKTDGRNNGHGYNGSGYSRGENTENNGGGYSEARHIVGQNTVSGSIGSGPTGSQKTGLRHTGGRNNGDEYTVNGHNEGGYTESGHIGGQNTKGGYGGGINNSGEYSGVGHTVGGNNGIGHNGGKISGVIHTESGHTGGVHSSGNSAGGQIGDDFSRGGANGSQQNEHGHHGSGLGGNEYGGGGIIGGGSNSQSFGSSGHSGSGYSDGGGGHSGSGYSGGGGGHSGQDVTSSIPSGGGYNVVGYSSSSNSNIGSALNKNLPKKIGLLPEIEVNKQVQIGVSNKKNNDHETRQEHRAELNGENKVLLPKGSMVGATNISKVEGKTEQEQRRSE